MRLTSSVNLSTPLFRSANSHLASSAGRRASKLISVVVSLFAASYVRFWPTHFVAQSLLSTPCFDGRAVLYPSDRNLRDYLAWRQVDTHVNNQVCILSPVTDLCVLICHALKLLCARSQYNTCFWALVHSGKAPAEAQAILKARI